MALAEGPTCEGVHMMRLVRHLVLAASALALAAPLTGCSQQSTTERILADLEEQQPVIGLLREHEPSSYDELRALIDRTGREGEVKADDVSRRGREIFSRLVERRMQTAPDDITLRMIQLIVAQTAQLDSNPTVCADLLQGRAGDVRAFIPREMQEQEMKLYADLLRAPESEDAAVATQEQAMAAFGPILARGEDVLGLSEAQLAQALEGRGPPRDTCRANSYIFKSLSELPPDQAASVFRFVGRAAARQRRGAL
jgi:hypothetical protein